MFEFIVLDFTLHMHVETYCDLHDSDIQGSSAKVRIEYAYSQIHMYTQGSPAEIQTSAHNLIGHSMTTPPPVFLPSSILPVALSHWAFIPARKNLVCI
jgi:hypothetical protein